MNTEQHQTTLSELGFTIWPEDLQYLNEYVGRWAFTGEGDVPENYWLVTFDGEGHPVTGHPSPQEILDWGHRQGWQCAYAAPYGRFVVGQEDGIELHDWLRERRNKAKKSKVH